MWFDGQCRCAVTNVGVRPTVEDNDGQVTVEGFILDFDGDLYGHEIRMEFSNTCGASRRFPSMEALADEIRRNAQQTRDYFRQLT
ncbi:MAG: riboflavin kinase [Lawsonibacter sp.]